MNTDTKKIEKLNHLLETGIGRNPFYTNKLKGIDLLLPVSSIAEFTEFFPFTTKDELAQDQIDCPPYGTNLTKPISDYTRYHQTSGSSGNPIRWLDTPENWQWIVGNWKKIFAAFDVLETDRILFTFSFGPFLGFWSAFDAALELGCLCIPGGGLNSLGRLRQIEANQVTILCCTPTYAIRLGETIGETDSVDLSSVKKIIVAGEPGGSIPAIRQKIESLWPGANVLDHHGMTEVGPVSFSVQGDDNTTLHILNEEYIAEVIDPNSGKPVEPGKTGELILTALGRSDSPIIRYRTGDFVRRSKINKASIDLSNYHLEGGILGRIDDMVTIRGAKIYPAAVDAVIREHPEILEYQVSVTKKKGMSELEIKIELGDKENESIVVKNLQDNLKSQLNIRILVIPVTNQSLPRFEMKAKRWVRI